MKIRSQLWIDELLDALVPAVFSVMAVVVGVLAGAVFLGFLASVVYRSFLYFTR